MIPPSVLYWTRTKDREDGNGPILRLQGGGWAAGTGTSGPYRQEPLRARCGARPLLSHMRALSDRMRHIRSNDIIAVRHAWGCDRLDTWIFRPPLLRDRMALRVLRGVTACGGGKSAAHCARARRRSAVYGFRIQTRRNRLNNATISPRCSGGGRFRPCRDRPARRPLVSVSGSSAWPRRRRCRTSWRGAGGRRMPPTRSVRHRAAKTPPGVARRAPASKTAGRRSWRVLLRAIRQRASSEQSPATCHDPCAALVPPTLVSAAAPRAHRRRLTPHRAPLYSSVVLLSRADAKAAAPWQQVAPSPQRRRPGPDQARR